MEEMKLIYNFWGSLLNNFWINTWLMKAINLLFFVLLPLTLFSQTINYSPTSAANKKVILFKISIHLHKPYLGKAFLIYDTWYVFQDTFFQRHHKLWGFLLEFLTSRLISIVASTLNISDVSVIWDMWSSHLNLDLTIMVLIGYHKCIYNCLLFV